MIEFKEKVLEEGVVVLCESEEQANNLLKWADSLGFVWNTESSLLADSRYGSYGPRTCYDILQKGCRISPVEWYTKNGYTAIPYAEAVLGGEMKKGDTFYISNTSVEGALHNKRERIFLADVGGSYPYLCVRSGYEEKYPDGEYETTAWKLVTPIPKVSVPEMTMEEVVDKIGYNFKLVK